MVRYTFRSRPVSTQCLGKVRVVSRIAEPAYSPEHLIVHGDQFTGLDFDEFCQYDPRFDVAHFCAHLRVLGLTRFGTLNHFDSLADRFLASYEAGGGDCSGDGLTLYEAIAYFKLGRFVAVVERAPGWRRILPELLNEARRLLCLSP